MGFSVIVRSVLAILVISSNVAAVFVEDLGQRFTFRTNANWSLLFMALIFFVRGLAVAWHESTRFGLVLG